MAPKTKAQIGLEDRMVNNPELEKLLEERHALKASVSLFRKADLVAKEKILAVNETMPYRVGRFLITKQSIPGKTIAFETSDAIRVSIKNVAEDS